MEAGIYQMIALYKVEENFALAARPLIYEKHRLMRKYRALLSLFTSIDEALHSTYINRSSSTRLLLCLLSYQLLSTQSQGKS